jgi:hypothetical protein
MQSNNYTAKKKSRGDNQKRERKREREREREREAEQERKIEWYEQIICGDTVSHNVTMTQ